MCLNWRVRISVVQQPRMGLAEILLDFAEILTEFQIRVQKLSKYNLELGQFADLLKNSGKSRRKKKQFSDDLIPTPLTRYQHQTTLPRIISTALRKRDSGVIQLAAQPLRL